MKRSEQLGRPRSKPKWGQFVPLGLVIASAAFACMPSAVQGAALSLASGNTQPGGTVALTISLGGVGSTQPGSLQWTMSYSATDISSVTVAASSAASVVNKAVKCNSGSGNTVCVLSGLDENTISAGAVATATFQVASNTKSTSIPVQLSGLAAADDASSISLSSAGGAITLSGSPSAPPSSAPISIWNSTTKPDTVTVSDSNAVELGMRFRSDVTGQVTGVRFYKGPQNTGTHVGHLWSSAGKPLGTVTFQNETASGWQQAIFAAPVSIQANTTYIVSYYAPAGYYSASGKFFGSAVNTPPLHALQNGADGPNGLYGYGASAFPTQSFNGNNYWVDVLFSPSSGATSSTPPATSASTSVWTPSAVPGATADADASAVEVGMKFRSDVAGQVTGVRFYKGPQNAGAHIGHLWTSAGAMLGSVTFQDETNTGWQQANFANPVAIQPNTTYVVSYYAPAGHYASDARFFSQAVNTPPLHALKDGFDGSNGVYRYGSSSFPNQSWNASNYWVDVAFTPNQ